MRNYYKNATKTLRKFYIFFLCLCVRKKRCTFNSLLTTSYRRRRRFAFNSKTTDEEDEEENLQKRGNASSSHTHTCTGNEMGNSYAQKKNCMKRDNHPKNVCTYVCVCVCVDVQQQ